MMKDAHVLRNLIACLFSRHVFYFYLIWFDLLVVYSNLNSMLYLVGTGLYTWLGERGRGSEEDTKGLTVQFILSFMIVDLVKDIGHWHSSLITWRNVFDELKEKTVTSSANSWKNTLLLVFLQLKLSGVITVWRYSTFNVLQSIGIWIRNLSAPSWFIYLLFYFILFYLYMYMCVCVYIFLLG